MSPVHGGKLHGAGPRMCPRQTQEVGQERRERLFAQLAVGEDEVRVTAALRNPPSRQVVGRVMQSDGRPLIAQQRRVARGIAGVAIRYAVLLQQKSVTDARERRLTAGGVFGEIVRVVPWLS